MSQGQRQPGKVIVSYSHRDAEALARLRVHLKPLERDLGLVLWDDTRLRAGDHWRDEIREAIATAGAAVLLVSADFLASDFIAEHELPPLVAAERAGEITLMAVVLGPCRYNETPALERLQSINPPSRPLSAMAEAEREAVWVRLANRIEEIVLYPPPAGGPAAAVVPKAAGARPARARSPARMDVVAGAVLVAVVVGTLAVLGERWRGRGTDPHGAGESVEAPRPATKPAPPPAVPATVLAGMVVDAETGDPLAGVTLTLEGHETPAVTDAHGRFHFDGLRPPPEPTDQVEIVSTRAGYTTSHKDVTLPFPNLTIKLAPAPRKDDR